MNKTPRTFLATSGRYAGMLCYAFDDGASVPVVRGGDGDTTEHLPEELRNRLAAVADATDEELAELEADLQAHLDTIEADDPTDEDLDAAQQTVAAIRETWTEAQRRYDAAEADAAQAEERRARMEAIRAEAEPEDAEGEGEGEGAEGEQETPPEGEGEQTPPADVEGETPPAGEGEGAEGSEGGQQAEPIAAAAPARAPYPRPGHRPPLERVAARRRQSARGRGQGAADRPRVTLTAAADLAGFAAGQVISDQERLAEAIVARADALRSVSPGADGMKYLVARGLVDYPEERRLSSSDARRSQENLDAVMSDRAIAASGGVCAPAMPDYTQMGISDDSRPVRGSLANFQADRGGVLHMPPPRFSRGMTTAELAEDSGAHDFRKGVGQWTQANDVALNNPATKPVARVDCEETITDVTYAVTQRLEIGNFYNMTYPERVAAIVNILNAEHAALGERLLLDTIAAGSKHVTAGQGLGAAADVLAHLDVAVAAFEWRWRMAENHPPLPLWLPDWLHDMIRADRARTLTAGSTDERFAVADADIDRWLEARNVAVTWTIDGETGAGQDFGAQADGAALAGWPSHVIGYLSHQGAWAFMDNGTIDLGIIRDSVLADTNDLQMFRETFEGALFRGWESLRIDMDVCPSGASQGTVSFDPCSTGS